MSSNAELERFWSGMKARAIGQALRLALCAPLSTSLGRECWEFYSQYDGQSWKNVISIGGLAVAPSSRRDACWC